MHNALIFAVTVLIWGTTWIAIAAQVGDVPVMLSIFLRFALAGALLMAGLAALGRLARPHVWRFVVIQAFCLFCFNFIGLYKASGLIASGLVALVFSLASIFNALNARLFFGDRIARRTLLAGATGAAGLALIFWQDVFSGFDLATVRGIAWATFGTLMLSFGTMASRRNGDLGIAPLTANAWGMPIGALGLAVLVALSGQPLGLTGDPIYWTALIYLALVGSIGGFTAYLLLAARIGSARAGYATVLFPLVALAISTVLEGYRWTPNALAGVALTLLGNVIMFWHLGDASPSRAQASKSNGATR